MDEVNESRQTEMTQTVNIISTAYVEMFTETSFCIIVQFDTRYPKFPLFYNR